MRSSVCEQTPVHFTADASGHQLRYKWSFSDQSYALTKDTWHSFKTTIDGYSVNLVVTDSQGCTDRKSKDIEIKTDKFNKDYERYQINIIDDEPMCAGSPKRLVYGINTNIINTNIHELYTWSSQNVASNDNFTTVYAPNTYFVHAEDTSCGCRGASRVDVSYTSTPSARFFSKQNYCIGDDIFLDGNNGDNYSYLWTIYDPNGVMHTFNDANIHFLATVPGTWTALLDVSGDYCSAATQKSFEVIERPPAPDIALGNAACVSEGPVHLLSLDQGLSLVWSNGDYGNEAFYSYAGLASAYYIAPTTGCRSLQSEIVIPFVSVVDSNSHKEYHKIVKK